jgi:hypothetical protein
MPAPLFAPQTPSRLGRTPAWLATRGLAIRAFVPSHVCSAIILRAMPRGRTPLDPDRIGPRADALAGRDRFIEEVREERMRFALALPPGQSRRMAEVESHGRRSSVTDGSHEDEEAANFRPRKRNTVIATMSVTNNQTTLSYFSV